MSQLIVRRTTPAAPSRLMPALVGLALGAAAGFVLGELVGPRAERGLTPPRQPPTRTMAELVHDALAALADDPDLGALGLEIIPVSRQTVELHGWVPSRTLRTRAARVVAGTIGESAFVNRLLVRGEDDAGRPDLDVLSA
jgi:hypothetical protein